MITEITVLRATCSKCSNRADYRVVQTNDDLKDKIAPNGLRYMCTGARVIYYCELHAPNEVRGVISSIFKKAMQPF